MSEIKVGDRVRVRDVPAMRLLGAALDFGTVTRVGIQALGVDIDGLEGVRVLFVDEVELVGSVPAPREVAP